MLNKSFFRFLLFSAFLLYASAQIYSPGSCPENVQAMQNFSVEKSVGTWYEFASNLQRSTGRCKKEISTLTGDRSFNVNISLIDDKNNTYWEMERTATLIAPGKVLLQGQYALPENYTVVNTDYDNYSVVYYCMPFGSDANAVILYVMTREAKPHRHAVKKALRVLRQQYNITSDELRYINQENCN